MSTESLYTLALLGKDEEIARLLDEGADVNKPDETGATPLYWAVWDHNESTTELLLKRGADPNIGNLIGTTPLHISCGRGLLEITKLLIEGGAYMHKEDCYGITPRSLVKNSKWRKCLKRKRCIRK